MRHKEWKMGTLVDRIYPVSRSNLLNNMAEVFANTGYTLPPSNLRTPLRSPNKEGQNQNWLPHPCLLGGPKEAEMVRHPAFSGIPKQRGTKSEVGASGLPSRGPKRGRKCNVRSQNPR